MKGQIFISYRREDSRGSTGRIYDRLLQKFSPEQIFMDVDTIEPGEDFVLAIEKAVSECDVLIAVIGRNWLRVVDKNGQRLLDSTNDFVRLEIKAALERNVRVIPLLVDKATMPEQEFLPEDIKIFSRRNAMEISHTRFNTDMEQLISALANILEKKAKEEQLKNNAKKDKEQKKRIAQQKEEALYWKRIEAENTKKAYSRYQNSYPNGKYFLEAGRKIRLLQKEEDQLKREAIRKVEALWYKCNQKNTIASYSDYLQTYPEGKYSDRARTKLQSLQELQKERTVLTRLNKRKVGKISNVFDTNNGTYKKLLDFVKQKKYELIALSAIIIGVIGAVSFYVGSASMENDEKSIVKRNIEFLSAHNINAYSADFSSDAILYEFFKDSTMVIKGIQNIIDDTASFLKVCPDYRNSLAEITLRNDTIVAYVTLTGTFSEDHAGFVTKNKSFKLSSIKRFTLNDKNKISSLRIENGLQSWLIDQNHIKDITKEPNDKKLVESKHKEQVAKVDDKLENTVMVNRKNDFDKKNQRKMDDDVTNSDQKVQLIKSNEIQPPPQAPEIDEYIHDDDVPEQTVPFAVVEEVPIFPGCMGISDKKTCFREMMQEHIRKHFRYPEIAQELGIQGRVSVMFTITRDGNITNIKVRGPDMELEKEARRIISLLPKMTPGIHEGNWVHVPFSIPITFKLQ